MITSDFPLVLFTLLVQCGIGLSFVGVCHSMRGKSTDFLGLWYIAALLTAFGLVSSLFHLTKMFAAYTALKHLGVSWLSNEALFVGLFFCGTLATALAIRKGAQSEKILALITAILGIASLIAQGLTYAPEAMPAINNAFPLALFVLTSLIAGAGITRVFIKESCDCLHGTYVTALWVFMALLFVVPCVWASGSETMRLTAVAWSGSLLFWVSGVCLLAARLLVKKVILSLILALLGLFLSRMVFFAYTVHTGTLLGFPY